MVLLIFKRMFNMRRMQRARTKRTRPRSVGRPSAQADADVRTALMTAAKALFLQHGFSKVTARQIAAAAGTTPAMIHYYFENKEGLFRAMLQEAIAPFARMLSGAVDVTQSRQPGTTDLPMLMSAHVRTAAANPWIASLIINEVLPEHGQFRATFIKEIAAVLLPKLVELIEQGRTAGRFRSDIDPHLTALSIVSLNMFPLISRPITAPLLGLKLEGEDLERMIQHTGRLLLHGISSTQPGVES
jgi:TetR/AcrR family transcriptional regulator